MEQAKTSNVLNVVQLAVLILALAGVGIALGRRDADLEHLIRSMGKAAGDISALSDITRDLATASARGGQRLDDLARRLERLEN